MHFSWNNSWLCFISFQGTLLLVQNSISWKKFADTKFYNSLKNEISEFVDVGSDEKHFLYTVLNTSAPQERMAEKNSSNGGQEKKSAASEVHYGRNFQILTRNYKVFFQ